MSAPLGHGIRTRIEGHNANRAARAVARIGRVRPDCSGNCVLCPSNSSIVAPVAVEPERVVLVDEAMVV